MDTNDLWSDLQRAYDDKQKNTSLLSLDIKSTMEPWLEQTGHPILNVIRDYSTGATQLIQKNVRKFDKFNKWRIPLNYLTKSNLNSSSTAPKMWLEKNETNVTIFDIDKDDWIILNINQTAFYQVIYDKENWRRIANYLDKEDYQKIPATNRAQLIRDAYDMYKKDHEFLDILVNLLSYLRRETDYVPWIAAKPIMIELNKLVKNSLAEDRFNKYMLSLLSTVMDHVGFDDRVATDNSELRTRRFLLPLTCLLEHPECRATGQRLFENFLAKPTLNA